MASKSVKKRPNGKWRARYRDASGKEHARHFDTRGEGQRWLDEQTTSMLTGRYVDPKSEKILVRTYATEWRKAQVVEHNTAKRHDTVFNAHLFPAFGDRAIGSIRQSEIQAWVARLSDGRMPGTVKTTFAPVKAMFAAAVRDRIIGESPCVGITLPKADGGLIIPLSTEQIWEVESHMPDHLRAMVPTMAATGLRPGEAAGMTEKHLKMLPRIYHVREQMKMTRPHMLKAPKTAASNRDIPLPQVAVDALAMHIAEYGFGPDGLIFRTRKDTLLNKDAFQVAFRNAFDAAGLPNAHAHDLRHYYASLLIHHGESVKVVQARLGHATAKETLDTYSHLFPDQEDSTRAAIDNVLGVALADSLRTRKI